MTYKQISKHIHDYCSGDGANGISDCLMALIAHNDTESLMTNDKQALAFNFAVLEILNKAYTDISNLKWDDFKTK